MERITFKISVRNLVEFILRSGDIDNRIGKTAQKEAMQEGSRMHRKIQGRMGADYQAEVSLNWEIPCENYDIRLEGRADGICTNEKGVLIDEIKGSYVNFEKLQSPIEVHVAQAKCYAYIYAKMHDLKEITVQITYCHLETEEIKRFSETISFHMLEDWFLDLIVQYKKWTDFQYEWRQNRMASIHPLKFPFPYREGQKELAADVYRTIYREKNLFLQAPTGVGKTISTVYPAVKAVGEGVADKIFYLTAKTVTRTVAKEAFDLLKQNGLHMKVLTLTAKEKICACEEMDCNPKNCPYAKGHFDRVNDAVYEMLCKEHDFSRDLISEYAMKYQVCPFEMSLDLSEWVDVIICDYNYVFDPNVCLKRFFAEGYGKGDYIFLIDEAHNLVDRAREMYSAQIYKEDILAVKKLIGEFSPKVERALEKCNKKLLSYKRECETYCLLDDLGMLSFDLLRLASYMDEMLQDHLEFLGRKDVLEFYLNLKNFLSIYEMMDENYVIYTEHEADGRFKLKLFCVNTAVNLQNCLNKGKSAIFFSATLLPVWYYKHLFSTKEDNYAVYAKSSFRPEQKLLVIGNDVSSKYTRRTTDEFKKIASYIYKMSGKKQGNYIAFFPSYQLLDQVLEQFLIIKDGKCECISQRTGMSESEREEFLEEFSKERTHSLVAFCVMGGIFGEGIDLKNEKLIGAAILGTGIPQVSHEREILKNYYDEQNENGFNYAYRYPGMNKVLQAAGRVIRTAEDLGVILLLDERLLQREYRELYPKEWNGYEISNLNTIDEKIEKFWSETDDI